MLAIIKEGNLKKVNTKIFNMASISDVMIINPITQEPMVKLCGLIPSAKTMSLYSGNKKKREKAEKSYKDQLKESQIAEMEQVMIMTTMKNEPYRPILFVCSDDEWDMGYMKTLGKAMEKKFDIKLLDAKELSKDVDKVMDKNKKKKKKDKKKAMQKLLDNYVEEFGLGSEGSDKLKNIQKKYAISNIIADCHRAKVISIDDEEVTVNNDNLKKHMSKKKFIKALQQSYNSCKMNAKVIDKVFNKKNIKIKKIDKLKAEELLGLCITILDILQEKRIADLK